VAPGRTPLGAGFLTGTVHDKRGCGKGKSDEFRGKFVDLWKSKKTPGPRSDSGKSGIEARALEDETVFSARGAA